MLFIFLGTGMVWESEENINNIFILFQIFCDILISFISDDGTNDNELANISPKVTEKSTTKKTKAERRAEESLKANANQKYFDELVYYRSTLEDVRKSQYLTIINFAYHFFQVCRSKE